MNQTIIMPIGIIEEPTPAGATFRLTPKDRTRSSKSAPT